MNKQKTFIKVLAAILVMGFLSLSLMTIAPVQDVDARPIHWECTTEYVNGIWVTRCKIVTHWHWSSH